MTETNARLAAIRSLLDDEQARKSRQNWEAILADKSLTPQTETGIFQEQFYDLLITEMEEGYKRNDKLRQEKRQKMGRSRAGGYIPPQMRVTPTIGRFLFAYFKWHDFSTLHPDTKIKGNGLEDIAEAFQFRIDPTENQRQFLTPEERQKIINKEHDGDYNKWLWKTIIGGFISMGLVMFAYLRWKGWL